MTEEQIKELMIPRTLKDNKYEYCMCEIYDYRPCDNSSHICDSSQIRPEYNGTVKTVECDKWIYETNHYTTTIVTEVRELLITYRIYIFVLEYCRINYFRI